MCDTEAALAVKYFIAGVEGGGDGRRRREAGVSSMPPPSVAQGARRRPGSTTATPTGVAAVTTRVRGAHRVPQGGELTTSRPHSNTRSNTTDAEAVLTGAALFRRIKAVLDERRVAYRHFHHAAVRTSAEAARVRGTTLESGAKAMLFSGTSIRAAGVDSENGELSLALVVLSATRKLDMKAVRKLIGRKARFASESEVMAASGCEPGAVPPFGSLMRGVTTFMDESLRLQGDDISFNAGLRTDSLVMSVADYVATEKPRVVHVSCEPE
mmetsp:Transcript_21867/g.76746  ORF Transcript_21867/g.76746 Transcript_21867/m.76746 type:complete len:269 (-) Transcript_21867:161-967(-)